MNKKEIKYNKIKKEYAKCKNVLRTNLLSNPDNNKEVMSAYKRLKSLAKKINKLDKKLSRCNSYATVKK